jgi:hypothetical protein
MRILLILHAGVSPAFLSKNPDGRKTRKSELENIVW